MLIPDGFNSIVPTFGNQLAGSDSDYVCIVLEYVKSDLKKVLNTTNKIQFREEHVLVIFYNLLCALNFLHTAGIMH